MMELQDTSAEPIGPDIKSGFEIGKRIWAFYPYGNFFCGRNIWIMLAKIKDKFEMKTYRKWITLIKCHRVTILHSLEINISEGREPIQAILIGECRTQAILIFFFIIILYK